MLILLILLVKELKLYVVDFPRRGNIAEANGTYIFNDFINIDGCQDNSVLYIDNDILTLANDDIIVYDIYNHRFCARSYKTIDNVQKLYIM